MPIIDYFFDGLIHLNVVVGLIAFGACVAYVVKHRNSFRCLFLWKAFIIGSVTVIYFILALGWHVPREYVRIAWLLQLMIPIALAISLWGANGNHDK